jgi:hypothetical protein
MWYGEVSIHFHVFKRRHRNQLNVEVIVLPTPPTRKGSMQILFNSKLGGHQHQLGLWGGHQYRLGLRSGHQEPFGVRDTHQHRLDARLTRRISSYAGIKHRISSRYFRSLATAQTKNKVECGF